MLCTQEAHVQSLAHTALSTEGGGVPSITRYGEREGGEGREEGGTKEGRRGIHWLLLSFHFLVTYMYLSHPEP